jgi:hypothetical protein
MQANEKALRRYFSQRPCAACQRRQEPETVLTLISRTTSAMVLVTCAHCHHRAIYVISSRLTPTTQSPPISQRDVHAMHSFLDTFNGDFLSLFNSGSQGYYAAE